MGKYDTHVSICEPDLVKWIDEMISKGSFKPSLIFRDAVIEKKKEWDSVHSENPVLLHKRIKTLQETIKEQSAFITDKGLWEDWFASQNNVPVKPEIKQVEELQTK